MASSDPIEINDPSATASEAPVIVVNLRSGKISEIPCGPRDAAYFSGDRIVVWDKNQNAPAITWKHRLRWRFYKELCADPEIAKKHGLKLAESLAYFAAYLEFIRARGLGAKAKALPGVSPEDVARLWHPELRELRAKHRAAGGQARMGEGLLERITAGLTPGKDKEPKA